MSYFILLLGIPVLFCSLNVRIKTTNMDYTLPILFSLLQLVSGRPTAAPGAAEVVKMKSKVKWMAEQLVVRLDKDFQVTCKTFLMVTRILKKS